MDTSLLSMTSPETILCLVRNRRLFDHEYKVSSSPKKVQFLNESPLRHKKPKTLDCSKVRFIGTSWKMRREARAHRTRVQESHWTSKEWSQKKTSGKGHLVEKEKEEAVPDRKYIVRSWIEKFFEKMLRLEKKKEAFDSP